MNEDGVAAFAARVADLPLATCVTLTAALQTLQARTAFLQDLTCAQVLDAADEDPDYDGDGDPRSRFTDRFRDSSVIAEAATACHLTPGAIWWRAHRARYLADHLPGTRTRAATGLLGPAAADLVIAETRALTPAARHRLDHVIAGRPDPRTPDTGETGTRTPEALRPLTTNNWATPRRFTNAVTARADHLKAQTAAAQAAEQTAAAEQAAGHDDAGQDGAAADPEAADTSQPDTSSGPAGEAGAEVWDFVEVRFGRDGNAVLSVGGNVVDILTLKAALDAARKQGHTSIDTLASWAAHALAGLIPAGGGPEPRPHIFVTVPLATLTGAGTVPAFLHGYGPLPAHLFTELWNKATVRCGLIDDSGTLVSVGHSTHTQAYTPPDRLRRFLTVEWVHCAFPGCDKPARDAQLDHTIPYPAGDTGECNLRPLCALHHNLKTHRNWSYRLYDGKDQPPGTLEWTSPLGRTYYTSPGLPEITSWWPDHHQHPDYYEYTPRTPKPTVTFNPNPPPPPPVEPDDDPPPF